MAQARRVIGRRKMCRFGLGVMGRKRLAGYGNPHLAERGLLVAAILALLKTPCRLRWYTFGEAVCRSQRPASDGAVYGLRLPATHKSRSQVTDSKNVLRHAMMLRS